MIQSDFETEPAGDTQDAPPAPATAGRRASRERTVQVSLRLPANWMVALRQRALAAAAAEDAMITPQEIVRRMIADSLKPQP